MVSQSRGEETRARILAAAADCFARHGYDATGVAEICRCAGITKGGFYHHFSTKQAVFLELLEQWLSEMDAQFEILRSEATWVPAALMQMAEMVGRVLASGEQLPIFFEYWRQAVHDPAVRQITIAPYRHYRDFFARMIEAGTAEGSLRPVDPQVAAHVLVSMAVGLVVQGAFDPHGADWGQVTRNGVRMFLDMLEKEE